MDRGPADLVMTCMAAMMGGLLLAVVLKVVLRIMG